MYQLISFLLAAVLFPLPHAANKATEAKLTAPSPTRFKVDLLSIKVSSYHKLSFDMFGIITHYFLKIQNILKLTKIKLCFFRIIKKNPAEDSAGCYLFISLFC
ncbi:hypothetical protein HSISB1_505 [Streptococcus sp. HSISB1]|nr:hypothetical protein HSISB1_505 [Streptococcus sp. HSISB1]